MSEDFWSQGGRSNHKSRNVRSGDSQQLKSVNPLIESWLIEWRNEAQEKNSKMQYVYGKALNSLRRYPLELGSGEECLILENFGPAIAKMIDKRMDKENISRPGTRESIVSSCAEERPRAKVGQKRTEPISLPDNSPPPSQSKTSTRSKRSYVPVYRSGAYGLLVTLRLQESLQGYRGYMTKSELIERAAPHCDLPAHSDQQSIWNGAKPLLAKHMVIKQGHPAKYFLTPEGRELASRLLEADDDYNNLPVTEEHCSEVGVVSNSRTHYSPGQFEVVLIVDTSETTAKCKKEDVIEELRRGGVALEVVRLSVGDFVWVVRPTHNHTLSPQLLLPFVVERKRADDLAHSIKDGRFHEQKERLGGSGLQVIYLFEEYGRGDFGLAEGALSQALCNTQLQNGFLTHRTAGIKATCAYLTQFTKHLKRIYEDKDLSSCTKEEWPSYKSMKNDEHEYLLTFTDFNDFGTKTKNWRVSEMFARQLMRIRGLSLERAQAIVRHYPTLSHLIRHYKRCSKISDKEKLLAPIHYGNHGRTIGPNLSKIIYNLYSCSNFN